MKNKIYVARTDELNDSSVFQRLYNASSPERRMKTDKFVFMKDKMLSLAVEGLLRIALEDNGITDYTLAYGENGKPYLMNSNVFFNLSHSENTVICAVSASEIGADAEKMTEIDLDIAKCVFHPKEYEMLTKLETDTEKQDMFFRLWTLKESFMKALGLGLLLPPESFRIVMGSGGISVRQEVTNEQYFFKEYSLNDGYKYSVCSLNPQFEDKMAVVSLR